MKRIHWVLKRATVWALLVAVIIAAAMGVFTFVYEKDLYTATATLYLRPADALDNRFLQDCQRLAMGPEALQDAENAVAPDTLKGGGFSVAAKAVDGTHLLELSVTGPDAARCQHAANALAQALPQRLMTTTALAEGKVAQEALLPTTPSAPDRVQKITLTFVLCFLASMLLALLFWPAQKMVDAQDEWPLDERAPLLARVTDYRRELKLYLSKHRPERATLWQCMSKAVTEDVRTLALNLSFAAKNSALRSIVVTSRQPDEGKSSLIVLLATELARQDKSVLILDMDSYSPTISRLLGARCRGDLIDLFSGDATMERVLTETEINGLYCIGNRHNGSATAQLTSSTAFSAFMNHAYEQFDVVLVDTPPLVLYADALALGGVLDGVLLVAAENRETPAQLYESFARLEKVGAKVCGAVLTGERRRSERLYREYEADSAHLAE